MRTRIRLTAFGAAVSIAFLGLGFILGQPGAQPYLMEVLILTLAVFFMVLAAVGVYVFLRRVKPSDKAKMVYSVIAVALYLAAVLFIGRWIAMAELGRG